VDMADESGNEERREHRPGQQAVEHEVRQGVRELVGVCEVGRAQYGGDRDAPQDSREAADDCPGRDRQRVTDRRLGGSQVRTAVERLGNCAGGAAGRQLAPPRKRAGTVWARMVRSRTTLRRRAYSTSSSRALRMESRLRPLTCHKPVMPGFTVKRGRYGAASSCASQGSIGRGPTRDMSPRSTLTSCGNSSRLVRRSHAPSGVIRGSSASLNSAPLRAGASCSAESMPVTYARCIRSSLPAYMLRSFSIVKGLISRPSRSCRKNAGPADVDRTRQHKSSSKGAMLTISTEASAMSSALFTASCPGPGAVASFLSARSVTARFPSPRRHWPADTGSPTPYP